MSRDSNNLQDSFSRYLTSKLIIISIGRGGSDLLV